MTQTTQTNQPGDRCEQIARDIVDKSSSYCVPLTQYNYLVEQFTAALQAAKQQGREEVIKNSIELLGRGCERHVEIIRKQSFAEFRENYPACQWCLAEEVRTFQQQPKSEPSRECVEIAINWLALNRWKEGCIEEIDTDQLRDAFASALQAKQDEINELREEVLGVIEPFAECADRANALCHPVGSSCDWRFEVDVLRAALALRDKLKASQPTLHPPQTPHQ